MADVSSARDRAIEAAGWLRSMVSTSSRDWGQASGDALVYGVLVGWDCPPGVCDEAVEDAEHWCERATADLAVRHGWTAATVEKMRERHAALRALAGEAGAPAAPAEPEHVIAAGARALFDLTRAAQLSPNPDRLWERMCADGDRPYYDQAGAVLRAAWSSGEAGAPDTPPADAPELWWSRSAAEQYGKAGIIDRDAHGWRVDWNGPALDELPSDAVRLVPAAAPEPDEGGPVSYEPATPDVEKLSELIAPVMGAWTLGSPLHDRAPRQVAEAVIRAGWSVPAAAPTPTGDLAALAKRIEDAAGSSMARWHAEDLRAIAADMRAVLARRTEEAQP